MKGWLAGLVALTLAVPAAAQDDKPAWVGVWEGTVGNAPVRVCLDVWGGSAGGHGSYYYLSQLKPIALSEEDGGWAEHAPDSDATAEWNFTEQSAAALRGNWRQKRRVLPFALHPVAWSEGEWGGPCSAAAFLASIAGGGTVASEEVDLDGWRYTRRVYRPPARFADEVSVTSFVFPARQSGDEAINGTLAARLPRGVVGDDFMQCFAGAIASNGYAEDFEDDLKPVFVSDSFLVAMESYGGSCGGAHPNYAYQHLTYDRASGHEVDLFGWLGAAAVEHHPAESGGEAYATVRPALRELILSRDPTDFPISDYTEADPYDQECRDVVEDEEFWSLGLSRAGMLFVPSVPHVATPCMATFTVPWDKLAPFLSDVGRAGLARLRAK